MEVWIQGAPSPRPGEGPTFPPRRSNLNIHPLICHRRCHSSQVSRFYHSYQNSFSSLLRLWFVSCVWRHVWLWVERILLCSDAVCLDSFSISQFLPCFPPTTLWRMNATCLTVCWKGKSEYKLQIFAAAYTVRLLYSRAWKCTCILCICVSFVRFYFACVRVKALLFIYWSSLYYCTCTMCVSQDVLCNFVLLLTYMYTELSEMSHNFF
jgi:hypothetical protein